jgi:hypothetical protein
MLFAVGGEIVGFDERVGRLDGLGDGSEIGEESTVIEIGKILVAEAIGGERGQRAGEDADATQRNIVERETGGGGLFLSLDKVFDVDETLAEHEHSVVEAGEMRGGLRALGGTTGRGEVSNVVDSNTLGLIGLDRIGDFAEEHGGRLVQQTNLGLVDGDGQLLLANRASSDGIEKKQERILVHFEKLFVQVSVAGAIDCAADAVPTKEFIIWKNLFVYRKKKKTKTNCSADFSFSFRYNFFFFFFFFLQTIQFSTFETRKA